MSTAFHLLNPLPAVEDHHAQTTGRRVALSFVNDHADALIAQMERDVEAARDVLGPIDDT